jgi:hypothetical protein
VRIDNDTGFPEAGGTYEVRGLSADPGKLEEFLHRFGNATLMPFDEKPRGLNEVPRLCAEKAEAADGVFYLADIGLRHRRRIGPAREEAWRRPIHLLVGALSRERDRTAQLETGVVMEKRLCIRPEGPRMASTSSARFRSAVKELMRRLYPLHRIIHNAMRGLAILTV